MLPSLYFCPQISEFVPLCGSPLGFFPEKELIIPDRLFKFVFYSKLSSVANVKGKLIRTNIAVFMADVEAVFFRIAD